MAKTISEKITEKKMKMEAAQKRIVSEQQNIEKLKAEIADLESLEIKALLKEYDVPVDQLKAVLTQIKTAPNSIPSIAAQTEN